MLQLNHKKLNVYKQSLNLVEHIYSLTKEFPKAELYGLTSQMRRAVVSISSNIAEGASRFSKKERIRFYEIARSSLVELDTQVEISIKLNFINKSEEKELGKRMNSVFAMLSKLIANT